jgi:hypothetical protein
MEPEIEIVLNTIVFKEEKKIIQPSIVKLYPTHGEFYLNFDYSHSFKVSTGDDLMDKLKPQYETSAKKIIETLYIEKDSITLFTASEEISPDGTIALLTIESECTQINLLVSTYNEALEIINLFRKWKYGH